MIIGFGLIGGLLATGGPTGPAPTHSLADLIRGYSSWKKVNPHPIHMEPSISALCVGAPSWHIGNPHDPKFFTVYVNPLGARSMLKKGSTRFPVGSVIVKEKLPSEHSRPELLTVMVKRSTGFDKSHGDWEYFTADGSGSQISQANVIACRSCHDVSRANDYVFRTYVRDTASPWNR